MKVSVIGATGYTGVELVKMLSRHRHIELSSITSESFGGIKISDTYPSLTGICDMVLKDNDIDERVKEADAFFLCLPHKTSMEVAKKLYDKGKIVIDLSADFRINNQDLYEKTYATRHTAPEYLRLALYGQPELFGTFLKGAKLVAVPGCYPTSIIMPLYPLLKDGLIDKDNIIADSKSGVSGAGRKPTMTNSYCEVNEDFKPYGVFNHRHNVEIDYILSKAKDDVNIVFTPHLLPINRGILSTIYVKSDAPINEIEATWEKYYKNKPLVRIRKGGAIPCIKNVANSPFIDMAVFKKDRNLIIVSAIDNLLRGASAQALQCFNIIAGYDEVEGLL